ncbi:uncharacterized protein [Dermacentor albipictus]|uniref:uncharacterized protein isoform X2 n=1 Tax=Dermacentor albipictus TaxID=60249 RepID=UPI0038FC4147
MRMKRPATRAASLVVPMRSEWHMRQNSESMNRCKAATHIALSWKRNTIWLAFFSSRVNLPMSSINKFIDQIFMTLARQRAQGKPSPEASSSPNICGQLVVPYREKTWITVATTASSSFHCQAIHVAALCSAEPRGCPSGAGAGVHLQPAPHWHEAFTGGPASSPCTSCASSSSPASYIRWMASTSHLKLSRRSTCQA